MKKIIRLTENDIHRIVKNSVKRVLNEEVTSMSSEELQNKWKENGNSYNQVYPERNMVDLYALSNGEDSLYFSNKKEAMAWVRKYVTDPQTIKLLKDALANYSKRGGLIKGFNGAPSPA